jgi:uncharacterized protein
MVALMAFLFRRLLSPELVEQARREANLGRHGSMEGHAEMDIIVTEGLLWQRISSSKGFTATSQYFVMDWAAVWKDIAGGLLLAGVLGAWIPKDWWQAFFFSQDPIISAIWGPLVGPLVAVISFVCSIGNVPLAAVLWNGGISFGGVIAFIFADLIVLPILNIYRKYYGGRVALLIGGVFYISMVGAAWAIEALFAALRLIPSERKAQIVEASIQLNYTTVLNAFFMLLAAVLVWRSVTTGGPEMLKMMNRASAAARTLSHPLKRSWACCQLSHSTPSSSSFTFPTRTS